MYFKGNQQVALTTDSFDFESFKAQFAAYDFALEKMTLSPDGKALTLVKSPSCQLTIQLQAGALTPDDTLSALPAEFAESLPARFEQQKSYIDLTVSHGKDATGEALLMVMATASLCALPEALVVFTGECAWEPSLYRECFKISLEETLFPTRNLVMVHFLELDHSLVAITDGLTNFGMRELEWAFDEEDPENVFDTLMAIATPMITEHLKFKSGQVLEFENDLFLTVNIAPSFVYENENTIHLSVSPNVHELAEVEDDEE